MYKIVAVTQPVKKKDFEYLKIGLILEGPEGKIGGSVYFKEDSVPKYNVGEQVTVEEIKVNKDKSHTFRGVVKINNDNDTDIPLLF